MLKSHSCPLFEKDDSVKSNRSRVKFTRTYKAYTFLENFTWICFSHWDKKEKLAQEREGHPWKHWPRPLRSSQNNLQNIKGTTKATGNRTPRLNGQKARSWGQRGRGQRGEKRVPYGLSPAPPTHTHAHACTHKTHLACHFKYVNYSEVINILTTIL